MQERTLQNPTSSVSQVKRDVPLRVLFIEDSADDVLLLVRQLRRDGYEIDYRRVETPEAMKAALEEDWDIILSDHAMPAFSAPHALRMLQERDRNVPFIVVSGKIGEDAAVELMRDGAHDYVSKDNLTRLGPVVSRGLHEAEARLEHQRVERAVVRSEKRFRRLVEQAADAIFVHDLNGNIVDVNVRACESLGYTRDELLAMTVMDFETRHAPGTLYDLWTRLADGPQTVEGTHRRKDGSTFPVEVRVGTLEVEERQLVLALARDITDRKRAERAIRRAEEKYRGIFENAVEGIYQSSLDGRLLTANPALARIYGYASAEEMVRTVTDVGRQLYADADGRRRFLRLLKEQGAVSGVEIEGRRKDGSSVWTAESARAVRDEHGNLLGLEGTVEDITDRKRKEDALRLLAEASEALTSSPEYEATLKNLASLVVPVLADWCIIDVVKGDSIARLAVTHRDPEKAEWARKLKERYPPDPQTPRAVPRAMRTGKSEFYPEFTDEMLVKNARDADHLRIMRALGGVASGIAVPMVARGRVLGVISLVRGNPGRRYDGEDLRLAETLVRRAALAIDNARLYSEAQREVAERKRAEEELRKSEERYRTFIAQSTEGIWRMELEQPVPTHLPENEQIEHLYRYGYLAECNDAMARMHGFSSAEEIAGARLGVILPQSDPNNIESLRNVVRSNYRIVDSEARELDRHGNRRVFLNNVTGIIEDGSLVRMWGTRRDITERRKMEAALRQAKEAEQMRIARDLHDTVMQDLAYVVQQISLRHIAMENGEETAELREISGTLKRAVESLRAAVFELRLQGEADRSFAASLDELVRLNRRMARKNLTIELSVVGDSPDDLPERPKIELIRVLQEALANARRHSGASQVQVSLGVEGECLWAEVADNGRGFDTAAPDAGMGLSSMRQRAEGLGGQLEVESKSGEGTRVRLRVPTAPLPKR